MDDILKKIEDYVSLLDCSSRKIILDMKELARYDPKLADYVIDNFEIIEPEIRNYLLQKHKEINGNDNTVFLYINPHNIVEIMLWADAHPDLNGKLRKIWGTVISISPTEYYKEYFYRCNCCNKKFRSFKKRKKCPFCLVFDIETEQEAKFVYRDIILLEQKDEALSQEKIRARLFIPDDKEYNIVDLYNLLGHKVEAVGFLQDEIISIDKGNRQLNRFRFIIKGIKTKEVIKLTDDDKKKCREFILNHRDDLLDILCNEIWYGTYSYEYERKLLLLHAIGLHPEDKDLDNRSKQMCIMLVSDKGRNKSQMAKALLRYIPDGGMVTANSSSAGLLVGIEKDAHGEYTAILGDIPACNNSVCILEEADKLREEESASLLTVLSDGFIKTSKIKKFQMNVHINFILLANPTRGQFDLDMPYYSQLDMPSPFIDRMDSIIILGKAYDDETKMDFATKVLRPKKDVKRKLDDEFIKKLLFYMKHHLRNPKLTDEGEFLIAKKWDSLETIQKKTNKDRIADTKTIEARVLVSLLKICKAYGRMHLYDEINVDVVDKAYDLFFKGSMKRFITDYGVTNVTTFLSDSQTKGSRTKIPMNDDDRRQYILNLLEAKENGIDFDELIKIVKNKIGLTTVKIQTLIKQLISNDELKEYHGILTRKWSQGVSQEFVSDVAETFNVKDWIIKKLNDNPMTDIELVETAKEEHQLSADIVFKTIEQMVTEGDIMDKTKDGKIRVV